MSASAIEPATAKRVPAPEPLGAARAAAARPRWWIPFGIAALALVHHTAIAWEYALRHGVAWSEAICRWDCVLYADIARNGFHDDLWAFLPLFPEAVHGLSALLGAPPQWIGATLSALCLALFVLLVEALGRRSPDSTLLVPGTTLGWFVFLYSPAAYVFHSNHTEALFLVLSYGAFLFAARGRAVPAGLLAGLSVWTRNQGVFVAIACALLAAAVSERSVRARRFLLSGAVSLGCFGLLLAFEDLRAGNPLAFLAAQHHWTHAHSVWEVVRTFWFGNPWQNHNLGSLLHHAYFVVLAVLCALALRVRWPLGVYATLSLCVLPLQAELINGFRFSAVLFPLLFLAGDRLDRLPRWAKVVVVLGMIALNHAVTRAYVSRHWAY